MSFTGGRGRSEFGTEKFSAQGWNKVLFDGQVVCDFLVVTALILAVNLDVWERSHQKDTCRHIGQSNMTTRGTLFAHRSWTCVSKGEGKAFNSYI